jgi:hypothetical protein
MSGKHRSSLRIERVRNLPAGLDELAARGLTLTQKREVTREMGFHRPPREAPAPARTNG